MAEAKDLVKRQIKDITECPICSEMYVDPKVLPCIHTFCLKCLESLGKGKKPGDSVPCPLCRKEFNVPATGLKDLQKNFFLIKLLEIKLVSSLNSKDVANYCDACSDFKEEKDIASMYCINCQQYLCTLCGKSHSKLKFTKSHKVVTIDTGLQQGDLMKMSVSFCEQHPEDPLRLYCFDCKKTVCMMCFVEVHKLHNCSNIDKVTDEFRELLDDDLIQVSDQIYKLSEMEEQLLEEKIEFEEQVKKLRVLIYKRSEEIKTLIDIHTNLLVKELTTMREQKLKEMDKVMHELQRDTIIFESFKRYNEELKDKGTSCEIARVAEDLHAKAKELLEFDFSQSNNSSSIDVSFNANMWLEDLATISKHNLVGNIKSENKRRRIGLKF